MSLPQGIKSDPKDLSQIIVPKMIWVAPRKKLLGKWAADQTDHDMFLFSMLEEYVSGRYKFKRSTDDREC